MAGDFETTYFDLPTSPDRYGVLLAPAELRQIDFSSLDYDTVRRTMLEYIATYFPNEFNDFVASNGMMMIIEVLAMSIAKLSLRADLLNDDSVFATAVSETAVAGHLALIGQRLRRQTPATVDIEISVEQPVLTDIVIDPGLQFSINGPDNRPLTYEIYAAPGDFSSQLVIPAAMRGVIAYGLEGKFATPATFTSDGSKNQQFVVADPEILDEPLVVQSTIDESTIQWRVVTEPLDLFGSNDHVVEAYFLGEQIILRFGDNVHGIIPMSGSIIEVRFRVGGGVRGRIATNQIDSVRTVVPLPPVTASVPVRFRNITASVGGQDRESLVDAKKRAPREFALHGSIVTDSDYAHVAASFAHPVYGSISKAVATVRTSKNANLVEVYALAVGSNGLPVVPSVGLKTALTTYFRRFNVVSDQISVLDGAVYPIDIDMTVVMDRNADAAVVKSNVEAAITKFFDINNWQMGQPFYVSNFIEVVEAVNGVKYINVYRPAHNVLPTGQLSDTDAVGVGLNGLITAGQRTIGYYYDKTPTVAGSTVR